ncbi:UNVERIFIED_CONTAM: hypothetical protein Sangu_2770100 [Sesamum angustifolium]|uniref:Reverse transcriptase n=1 Tax=Sesamum angustifolium TaxID=2727405 RepID=A0AAW2ITY2_9LAMI
MGDFNAVLNQMEKKGGNPFASSTRFSFWDMLTSLDLNDLGFQGPIFTWSNKRAGCANIQLRLDRGVANSEWCLIYPNASIKHLPAIASDHCPLLLLTQNDHSQGPKPFFFEEMWLRDETCEEVVANNWFSPPTGNPHEQIHLRLKKLRQELRKWNKQTFGWCHSKIKSIENAIKDVQMKDQSIENLALEEALQVELDEQYKRVEVMWKQKAKQRWLKMVTRTREFVQNSHPFPPDLESLIPQVVAEEDNVSLCENPTADEIKSVVFEMAPFKSPGPDGFPPSFFKNFWHIVGTDVVKAVQHFFLSGAEIDDAQCIQDCILKYATWSNQAPNPSKSFVHFSSNVSVSAKRNILAVLQMPECTHKAVHLGLPLCKPRSRRQAFNHILDKLSGKLSGWKMKNLSQASRGVLIKSIGQALPIYHMSTFLLPKSLCGKMDSTLRKFWWGARQDKKFLALKCWDDICAPKNLGGLGFRKMWEFNKALVSKLAWQMCFPQDKLWSQILGAKYLHFNSFLELPGRAVGASWIWQGIMECREIIKEGACYHVFANSEIKIWQDPWIPTVQNFLPPEETCKNGLKTKICSSFEISWKMIANHGI